MIRRYVVAVACVLAGVAQAQTATQAQTGTGEQAGASQQAGKLNDAQIAAVVVVANQADIDAAKVAEARSHDKAVKEFAQTMVRDHEAVNKQAKALASQLGIKPESSPMSKSILREGKENDATLKKLRGQEFDKAYIDHEVAFHEQVLGAIHSTLLPDAKNAQLKSLIEKSTPVFQAHLADAKQLQSQLSSGTGTASTGHVGTTGTGSGGSGK